MCEVVETYLLINKKNINYKIAVDHQLLLCNSIILVVMLYSIFCIFPRAKC